jgi:hypothetical protein
VEREGEAEWGTRALDTQLRFRKTLKAREGIGTCTINDRLFLDARHRAAASYRGVIQGAIDCGQRR